MMGGTPTWAENQRDEAAARCVQDARARGRMLQYHLLSRNLGLLLRQHGLGQTLAYLQARGAGRAESPYQMMYEHVGNWLRERLGLPVGDALAALTRADSRLYLRATDEAGAFVLALRRALAREESSPRGDETATPTGDETATSTEGG